MHNNGACICSLHSSPTSFEHHYCKEDLDFSAKRNGLVEQFVHSLKLNQDILYDQEIDNCKRNNVFVVYYSFL